MCPYRDTWVMSQKASAALKYMSGVGAEPSPPRDGPSSHAKVLWAAPLWLTVASLRNGVTDRTSASNVISRLWMLGSSPSGSCGIASLLAVSRTALKGRAVAVGADHLPPDSSSGDSAGHSDGSLATTPGAVEARSWACSRRTMVNETSTGTDLFPHRPQQHRTAAQRSVGIISGAGGFWSMSAGIPRLTTETIQKGE